MSSPTPDTTNNSPFPLTHWTLIQEVQAGSPAEAAKAMETLCQHYWYPIYAYLRHSHFAQQDAEDLTQAFFEKLITEEAIQTVRQERGRLRSFLLGVLKRLLSDHARHRNALKRGGGKPMVSFDETCAEERYRREPVDLRDPEKLYLQAWARELIESVRIRLRTAFEKEGRTGLFELLDPFLGSEDIQPPYSTLAAQLNSSDGAVRLLVHRLRKKFRELLEEEVARTVMKPEDIAVEMAWLKLVLMQG